MSRSRLEERDGERGTHQSSPRFAPRGMPKKADDGSNALAVVEGACPGWGGRAFALDGAGVAPCEPGRWNGLVPPAPKMNGLPPAPGAPNAGAPAASVGERNELSLRRSTRRQLLLGLVESPSRGEDDRRTGPRSWSRRCSSRVGTGTGSGRAAG